jgi:hypothetical protein
MISKYFRILRFPTELDLSLFCLFPPCTRLNFIQFYSMGVLLRSIKILFLLIGFIYLFFSSNFSKIYATNLSNSSIQILKWEKQRNATSEKRDILIRNKYLYSHLSMIPVFQNFLMHFRNYVSIILCWNIAKYMNKNIHEKKIIDKKCFNLIMNGSKCDIIYLKYTQEYDLE